MAATRLCIPTTRRIIRPTNYAADAMDYNISPGYLDAAGTRLLAGRNLTLHDDDKAPKVALVNSAICGEGFRLGGEGDWRALQILGRNTGRGGGRGGRRKVPDADRGSDAGDVLLVSAADRHRGRCCWCDHESRSAGDDAGSCRALHDIDAGLPLKLRTWTEELNGALFAARVATVALGVLGLLGAMLAVTGDLWHGIVFGKQAAARDWGYAWLWARAGKQVLWASLGRAFRLLSIGSVAGLALGAAGDAGAVVHCVPGHAEGSAWCWAV